MGKNIKITITAKSSRSIALDFSQGEKSFPPSKLRKLFAMCQKEELPIFEIQSIL